MREIILQPGASIEIDGVKIRAAEPARTEIDQHPAIYDPATGDFVTDEAVSAEGRVIMLEAEMAESIRASLIDWLSAGDLSQAPLLRAAVTEVAINLTRFGKERPQPCEAAESVLSSHPTEVGTPA